MRKFRRTKITVKTREIISLTKGATNETTNDMTDETTNDIKNPVCPLCHTPLFLSTPIATNSAVAQLPATSEATVEPSAAGDTSEHICSESEIKPKT